MRSIDRAFERIYQSVLVAYLLFIIISWSTQREAIRITAVQVSGAHATNVESVKNIANNFLSETILWKIDRNNRFLYPKDNLSLALRSLDSNIKAIDLNVVGKKTLAVSVTEYQSKHLWCTSDEVSAEATTSESRMCYLADDDGYIFSDSPDYSGYPYDIYRTNIAGAGEQGSPIGLFMLPKDELAKVHALILELEKMEIFVLEVEQIDEHDYAFKSGKPWVFLWSSDKDPKESVANLSLAVEEISRTKKGTTTVSSIDLRFGNKIFYK